MIKPIAAASLIAALVFYSCNEDDNGCGRNRIPLGARKALTSQPRGIEGEYQGLLTVVNAGSSDSVIQAITMSIRENLTYGYENDTTDSAYGALSICNSSGNYSFSDGKLILTPTDTSGEVCDISTIPSGPGFSWFKEDIDGCPNEIGDKLLIRQDDTIEGTITEFELTLLSIP